MCLDEPMTGSFIGTTTAENVVRCVKRTCTGRIHGVGLNSRGRANSPNDIGTIVTLETNGHFSGTNPMDDASAISTEAWNASAFSLGDLIAKAFCRTKPTEDSPDVSTDRHRAAK